MWFLVFPSIFCCPVTSLGLCCRLEPNHQSVALTENSFLSSPREHYFLRLVNMSSHSRILIVLTLSLPIPISLTSQVLLFSSMEKLPSNLFLMGVNRFYSAILTTPKTVHTLRFPPFSVHLHVHLPCPPPVCVGAKLFHTLSLS